MGALLLSGWYDIAGPVLRRFEPETAHAVTLYALKHGLVPRPRRSPDAILAQDLWGLHFPNPVGLAAGFDKNAEVADVMLRLGFGFVEIGSVTPRPQPGNPRPRVFRLPDEEAIINRLGFNSEGAEAVAGRLERREREGIVGVNLGKNRDTADAADDYAKGTGALAQYADYLVCNVSSPNTPGLRALQGREALEDLLTRVQLVLVALGLRHPPPLLLKVAPDLTPGQLGDIANLALERGVAGLIVSNTTVARPADLRSPYRNEAGGLSGRPLFAASTEALRQAFRSTRGKLTLVGVGGISSGADAYAKIRAGASLVELYTALVYRGPGLVAEICRDLAALLRGDGFGHIREAIGADAR